MTVRLEVDAAQIGAELSEWLGGIEELTRPTVLTELAKAIFSITGQRFVVDVDHYARSFPKKMHHVYEWGQVGVSGARLFVIERSAILYGNLAISSNFLQSKMPVPINPELLTPGNSGKAVTRKSIFANKAEVMEAGTPVSFTAQRVLAFMGSSGVAFIAPGTQINIMHPGGINTTNAFADYMLEWYTTNADNVISASGFYVSLADDVAAALNASNGNASVSAVRAAVAQLANKIDVGSIIK
jgi:hypothetical protein